MKRLLNIIFIVPFVLILGNLEMPEGSVDKISSVKKIEIFYIIREDDSNTTIWMDPKNETKTKKTKEKNNEKTNS